MSFICVKLKIKVMKTRTFTSKIYRCSVNSDGWTLKRVSSCRGYLRVGRGYTVVGTSKRFDTFDIFVPNRRTRQQSNRYYSVIHFVKPTDLPF